MAKDRPLLQLPPDPVRRRLCLQRLILPYGVYFLGHTYDPRRTHSTDAKVSLVPQMPSGVLVRGAAQPDVHPLQKRARANRGRTTIAFARGIAGTANRNR